MFSVGGMEVIDCSTLGRVLREEWAVISTGRHARQAMQRWGTAEPVFAGLESPAEVIDAIAVAKGEPYEASIALSQAVLRLAATEELAARLLMQVMVPTLATECYRSLRVLRDEHLVSGSRIEPTSRDAVELVMGAAAEAIACYAGRTTPYPLRTIRRRLIELIVQRRSKAVEALRAATSIERVCFEISISSKFATTEGYGDPGSVEKVWVAPEVERSAAELLADTLRAAVTLGIVSEDDAGLVWASRYHGETSRSLAGDDRREAERLRRRRSRAQQRLIAHRDLLLATGIAV